MPAKYQQIDIAAVVVTFNRLELLQRLVKQLLKFDQLDTILVVDNASTDGTGQWLAETMRKEPRLRARTLPFNAGGAGGFEAGLNWAHDLGAELAWMMDDDGVPTDDCLDLLLEHRGEFDFWGPAVLAEQNPELLCFPIRLPGSATVARDLTQLKLVAHDGVVPEVVIPFNGVLVTRELVDRIGSVRAEFFIWGDDVEYLWRAKDAGARVGTVVDAHFLHPMTDDLGTPMMFGLTTYNHSPSDLKHYCMARNNTVNLITHHGMLYASAFWLKTAWFYCFVKPSIRRLLLSARAIKAGLDEDFTGHTAFLKQSDQPRPMRRDEKVAAVVVTYQRPALLDKLLTALGEQTRPLDAIYVVDNSGDDETTAVLAKHEANLPLVIDHTGENLGGAGGFHRGVKAAYKDGFDWIWLMDDDVRPAPWALQALLRVGADTMACVREDPRGKLIELAAMKFDLANPLRLRPKVATVAQTWKSRAEMPATVPIENAAFEGFITHRRVIDKIGLPDPSYFIFYDDCDFQIRARRAGFKLLAVRDALIRRAYDFSQEGALASWKGYYMFRNLFAVHYRYGENLLVKLKPLLITAGVVALSPLRGGVKEARNVLRALVDSVKLRKLSKEC